MATRKKTATTDKSKRKTVKTSSSSKAVSQKKVSSGAKSPTGAKKSAVASNKTVTNKKTATKTKSAVKKKTVGKKKVVSKKKVSVSERTAKAKKTSTSKIATKSSLIVEPGIVEDPLTPEEIEKFNRLLLEKRKELVGDVGHMHSEALDNNRQDGAGDLSNMPIHMADIGTDNYEQEFTLGLIESERKLLHNIDRALIKISQGNYGICEVTGTQINRSRLEAKPEARYCIEYARKIEAGLVRPEELENGDTEISV